jgi:hypothetical protein
MTQVEQLINGIATNKVRPKTLRGNVTREQVSQFLGVDLVEASRVRGELALIVAKGRLERLRST